MDILENTEEVIKQYLTDFARGTLRKPERCWICGRKGRLTWHGKYRRRLITAGRIYDDIPVKRLYCPLCGRTFALIPGFIEKYRHYGRDVIKYVVREIRKEAKIGDILDRVTEYLERINGYIEIPTIYRWKKRFANT